MQIREIPKKGTRRRAWFPGIQERTVLTGDVAVVRIDFLLEPGGIPLDFSSTLGFYKRVLALIRVLVLPCKSRCLPVQRSNHKVFLWGITSESSLAKDFYQRVMWIRVVAVLSTRPVFFV